MLSLALIIIGCNSKKQKKQVHEHWDYNHIDKWAKDYPDCANVDESPINVETESAIIDEEICVAEFVWDIDYEHHTFKIVNNGHSLQAVKLKFSQIKFQNVV